MSPSPDYTTEAVDPEVLRRFFSDGDFETRAARGELTTRVRLRSERPTPAGLGEPPGTVSHILRYFDKDGRVVAIVHEYVLPDGSLGASGQRDPKWVRIGDKAYRLASSTT